MKVLLLCRFRYQKRAKGWIPGKHGLETWCDSGGGRRDFPAPGQPSCPAHVDVAQTPGVSSLMSQYATAMGVMEKSRWKGAVWRGPSVLSRSLAGHQPI